MNYFNIQKEILKNAENKFLGKKSKRYFYSKNEKQVMLSDGYYIIIIPLNTCVLNLEEVAEKNDNLFNNIISSKSQYCAVKINSIVNIKGVDCQEFEIPVKDNTKVYVNQKYLKDFEKKVSKYDTSDLTFECDSSVSPLYVYRYDELIGAIMPIKKR